MMNVFVLFPNIQHNLASRGAHCVHVKSYQIHSTQLLKNDLISDKMSYDEDFLFALQLQNELDAQEELRETNEVSILMF